MSGKLRGAFHGCPHHGDDYEACIQHSGTAPCGVTEERDAAADYASDQATLIELLAKALSVPDEPHQGRAERILEAVSSLNEERDRFERLFANACESMGAVQDALGAEEGLTGLEPELVRELIVERDALAAHVNRICDAWVIDDTGIHDKRVEHVRLPYLRYEAVNQAIMATPATSLTRIIAKKQAQALEEAADCTVPAMHKMANWLRARAAETRRQAGEGDA